MRRREGEEGQRFQLKNGVFLKDEGGLEVVGKGDLFLAADCKDEIGGLV